METLAIVSVVLGCIAIFFGLSLWIILEEARRLKASNNYFSGRVQELLRDEQKYEIRFQRYEKRLQRFRESNNRYKAKLHRREMRIKNLLSKIEKSGL